MPLLPLTDGLLRTSPFDAECAALADRHYSRRSVGSNQFAANGRKIVLRDTASNVLFVWMYHKVELRFDGQEGYYCQIFHNESERRASDIVREAEDFAVREWGAGRAYTYIDPARVTPTMVRGYPVWGFCFYKAGWSFVKVAASGKHLLEKRLEF